MYTYTGRQTHLHTHDVTLPKKATFMKLPDDGLESGTHFLYFLSSNDFPPDLNRARKKSWLVDSWRVMLLWLISMM